MKRIKLMIPTIVVDFTNTLVYPETYINNIATLPRENYEEDVVAIICPCGCGNTIYMTQSQLNDLRVAFVSKYNKYVLPFFSLECRDEYLRRNAGGDIISEYYQIPLIVGRYTHDN